MVAQIVIGRKICQIVDEKDSEFLKKLDVEISFIVPGSEYSKAFKGYTNEAGDFICWDGRHHLLSTKLNFAPGLLHRVEQFYKLHKKQYNLVDHRFKIEIAKPADILPVLYEQNKIPYDYQLDAVNTAANHDYGIVRIATGGGKSICIALLTAKLNKSTCIYVIGTSLLYQIHKLFSSLFDEKIGVVGDGICDIQSGGINIVSCWSANIALGLKTNKNQDEDEPEKKIPPEKYKHIKNMLLKTQVHIFDECQIIHADSLQSILKYINAERIYGFSASPYSENSSDILIESYLGNKIVDISAKELIDKGYLVPPKIRFLTVPPNPDIKRKEPYKSVYTKYIINNDVRNDMIIKGTQKLCEQDFKTLVLFQSLNHGQILYERLKKILPCEIISGASTNEERDIVRDKIESGKIQCVVASKILDIGIDWPCLSGLVLAPAGKSPIRSIQRIGRVMRKSPLKTMAAVLEFADQCVHLLGHSEARYEIYKREQFDVSWPNKKQ